MPRAEAGTTKAIANAQKSKGLQRLRFYCQVCERQMRDENGFKCHVQSESHVRQMLLIGEDPHRAINDYTQQFQRDFLQLLRTSHGEKKVQMNHFYQTYISCKTHIHMNATRFNSLTEFAKYLGREGICRVEEEEGDESGRGGGIFISWIDNSPEALRRQDTIRKKERQDRGDEERELQDIEEQIRRAQRAKGEMEEDETDEDRKRELQRVDGEKIKLNFGAKQTAKPPSPPLTDKSDEEKEQQQQQRQSKSEESTSASPPTKLATPETQISSSSSSDPPPQPPAAAKSSSSTFNLKASAPNKPKNVFAAASKKTNLLGGGGGTKKQKSAATTAVTQQRPVSEAERIMKEEMERKRMREEKGKFKFSASTSAGIHSGVKRQRVG